MTKKYSIDDSYFKNIDNQHKAYWLGFLMADGCVYKGDSKNSFRLQINLSANDVSVLEKLKLDLSATNPIFYKKIINKKNGKEYNTVMLKINSTKLCMNLIKHGCILNKTCNCSIPKMNKRLIRHFIRGYFDGDGCITKSQYHNKISFGIVGGEEILNQFQDIFKENGITTHIYRINHSKAMELHISSKKEILKIYKYLYNYSSIFLERKRRKFEKILSPYLATDNEKNSD